MRHHLLLAFAFAVGCTSSTTLDGTYTGAVTGTGTCVPATIKLVFQHGTLISVDAGTNMTWTSTGDPTECGAAVTNGSGTVTCSGMGAEIPCSQGGYDASGQTKLTLTSGVTLEGTFETHITTQSPPACVVNDLCDGTGTVTFERM